MKKFIHKDKISLIMTLLLLLFLVLSNLIFSQPSFTEVSDLKINFGNGFTIENLYQKDSLLFVLMHRNYDLCAGIYNISDIDNPVELGRQEKDEYRGIPHYKDYLTWSETLPAYIIKTNPQSGKVDHLLMKHFSALYKDSLIYEVRGYESKINIYKILNGTQIELLKTISLLHKINEVKNVSIFNNVLYASARSSGILMLDLSDPLNPKEKILLEKADIIGHVTGGNRMLAGREFSTLIAFDISDPWNPVQLKSLNYSHPIFDCAYDGKHFFVSGHQSVSVFDGTAAKVNEVNTKGNLYEL